MKIRRKLYETTVLLIWFVLLMFGIYLRKKNIVKVPLWLEIFLFVLFVLIFVALYSYVLFIS